MKPDIRQYARIGLVHHGLFPKSMADPDYHAETLAEFAHRDDIEVFDCCIPFGDQRREKLIPILRDCGKQISYAAHLFPYNKISHGSLDPQEQGIMRLIMADQIEIAAAIGATDLVFASGKCGNQSELEREKSACADFCRWLCAQLKPHGMTALLEPFDRDFTKNFLFGPTEECVDMIRSLEPEVDNLAIELDFAHIPQMKESFEQAIRTTLPYLKRVHLGNCVTRDSTHPQYGDQHPPIGIDGGDIDTPQLTEILRLLLEVGFLNENDRGPLLLEMQPLDKPVEKVIIETFDKLHTAWSEV